MESKNQTLPRNVIIKRFTVALSILFACLLFVLYLYDIIKLNFLQNLWFKIIITVIALSFTIIYLIKHYNRKKLYI